MSRKILFIGFTIILFISMGMVTAESNVTFENYGDFSPETAVDTDIAIEQDYDSENYQPRIIPQEYDYSQDIPEQINYSTDYEDYEGYYISIVDENGDNIPDLKVRLVDSNTNREEMIFEYLDDEDLYWCCVSAIGIGNHSCKIIVDDYHYDIKPINFNLNIVKSDVELFINEIYTVKGDYVIIKAEVTNIEGDFICNDGKVKFTVNGKKYYRSVDENGVAKLKVKMNKAGSFSYSAKYVDGESHNPSFSEKNKIHVLSVSKKARTISIKGYKVVIPLDKYKKLIKAKSSGKTYVYKLSTGKTIKQKVDIINKKTYKRTTKTVKSKVFFYIAFDGAGKYTGSLPINQYVAEITTTNQHRYGNVICHKWLTGYKQAKQFSKLNTAKVRQKLYSL